MKRRLVSLISTEGKSPEEIKQQAQEALANYNKKKPASPKS